MTTEILKAIRQVYANYDYKLFNTYVYGWESDFICVSPGKQKYIYEFEVKVSRSDFKADFKKIDKHALLLNHREDAIIENRYPHYLKDENKLQKEIEMMREFLFDAVGPNSIVSFCKPSNKIPNRFYYVCPDGLIQASEMPKYAGLYWYNKNPLPPYPQITEIKPAPFLHKETHDISHVLLGKYYNFHNSMADRFYELKDLLYGHVDEDGRKLLESFLRKLSI